MVTLIQKVVTRYKNNYQTNPFIAKLKKFKKIKLC